MDSAKFEQMFPTLLNHYPQVRQRDHYRAPQRKQEQQQPQQQQSASAEELAATEDFGQALDVFLSKSLGANDAARVRRAFVGVYEEHLRDQNLEDVEEIAKAYVAGKK